MRSLSVQSGGIFTASALKLIACIFMTVDHIGAYLFPHMIWLRVAGRIAFPIFAYFIAEGCCYTRNKAKRLLLLLILGVLFEGVCLFVFKRHYGNIFLTFTLSVILIYALEWLKRVYFEGERSKIVFAALVFFALLAGVWAANRRYHVDYGFYGVLVPVFAALFEGKNNRELRLFSFSAGLVLLAVRLGLNHVQVWSLMSVPLLALYNGEAGAKKFKYGFYIFYPVHLIVIWLLGLIV